MRASKQRELKLQRSCGRRQTTESKKAGWSPEDIEERLGYRTGQTGQANPHSFFFDSFKDLGFYPESN